jgi:hypothetical protein
VSYAATSIRLLVLPRWEEMSAAAPGSASVLRMVSLTSMTRSTCSCRCVPPLCPTWPSTPGRGGVMRRARRAGGSHVRPRALPQLRHGDLTVVNPLMSASCALPPPRSPAVGVLSAVTMYMGELPDLSVVSFDSTKNAWEGAVALNCSPERRRATRPHHGNVLRKKVRGGCLHGLLLEQVRRRRGHHHAAELVAAVLVRCGMCRWQGRGRGRQIKEELPWGRPPNKIIFSKSGDSKSTLQVSCSCSYFRY